jgi:hypothetical protein
VFIGSPAFSYTLGASEIGLIDMKTAHLVPSMPLQRGISL